MITPRFDNSLQDLPYGFIFLVVEKKIFFARTQAGWFLDDTGWYAPDGTHESDWQNEFPEEHLF